LFGTMLHRGEGGLDHSVVMLATEQRSELPAD